MNFEQWLDANEDDILCQHCSELIDPCDCETDISETLVLCPICSSVIININ